MSDPKGKGSVIRPNADPTVGQDGGGSADTFEQIGFLEDSNALLDKIKTTAENVTTCQNQIEELFYRLGVLILALKEDSKGWSGDKIQQTATKVEDLMKRCHRQMQRFAIYGRVKAFVQRKELTAWIESFMVEINSVYKSFSTSTHEDLEDAEWVPNYEQAKELDKRAAWEQAREIALYEADVKMILGMGKDAITTLTKSLDKSIEEAGYDASAKGFTQEYHRRLNNLIQTRLDTPEDFVGESSAARAKREEAEWEFVAASGQASEEVEDEYNPPPRWEPWTSPSGTVAAAAGGIRAQGAEYASVPPPGVPSDPVPGDAPPGYF